MTSKKCLVMNLKVSRGRLGLEKSPVHRGMVPKRPNGKTPFQIGPSNGGFPMMPKYADAMMPRSNFVQHSSTPSIHPFYMAAPPTIPPLYNLPALSHFLEQLASPINSRPKTDSDETSDLPIKEEIKEEEEEKQERTFPNGTDLEAVTRILETVNATVTKQRLLGDAPKFLSSPSESSSVSPSGDSRKDDIECRNCGKSFQNRIDHHQHERYLCESLAKSEGLAAKLEDVASEKSGHGGGSSDEDDGKEGDMDDEGVAITTQEGADGRKVRVRSLIADEHLTVLKRHYMQNPRPKRDELSRIANDIGFPVRVVQVWFQNTRARDRREGRILNNLPFLPMFQNSVPLLTPNTIEQPLDLSTKKARSESPTRPNNFEVMNLSRRPLSPRPHTFPNGLPNRRTPSPLAYLNLHQDDADVAATKIRMQHANMLHLERFGFNSDSFMDNGRASSSSPSSDKRSWRHVSKDVFCL